MWYNKIYLQLEEGQKYDTKMKMLALVPENVWLVESVRPDRVSGVFLLYAKALPPKDGICD